MLHAAKALVKLDMPLIDDDPDRIVDEFRARYYDTQKFFDPFAGGKFAHYLFAAHEKADRAYTPDSARYLIDEAHLFIEAAHSCYNRLGTPRLRPDAEDTQSMELQHVNVKLLLANPDAVDLAPLFPIFNSWIQNQAPSELLLDIADYRHVPDGPGVVLIGHQGNTAWTTPEPTRRSLQSQGRTRRRQRKPLASGSRGGSCGVPASRIRRAS